MIEVRDIVKRYGDHTAVDHLSFTMEKGRIYGFLGPNGAGKSTTMNIMTGYIAASEGTVTINGLDIVREPEEAKRHIGYLPELPPLYQDMTILEFLRFVAELKRVPKKERRDQVAQVMARTMLGEYQHRLIRNLSKGYKQRVGLAQALIGSPEVIILDEPTVGLDPQQILEIRDLIKSLREDHIVMLSSHILSEVNAVCDEVMILSHGRLVASGTPEELERSMQKSTVLHIQVLGAEEAVRGALSGMEHVKEIACGEPGEDGSVSVTVETDSNEDIRPEIARALAAAGLPVMSMNVESRSLEDVFLELTAGEAERPEAGAEPEAPEESAAEDVLEHPEAETEPGEAATTPETGVELQTSETERGEAAMSPGMMAEGQTSETEPGEAAISPETGAERGETAMSPGMMAEGQTSETELGEAATSPETGAERGEAAMSPEMVAEGQMSEDEMKHGGRGAGEEAEQ